MEIIIGRDILGNIETAAGYEWLETNGIGGYSSSTIAGMNTRRYHGLLVSAIVPPTDRAVMLSKLDETIITGSATIPLATNHYGNTIYPEGYRNIEQVSKGVFTGFVYKVAGFELVKTITMVQNENTTLVSYEVKAAPEPFVLQLLPLIAGRGYHSLKRKNNEINLEADFTRNTLKCQPYSNVPAIYITIPGSKFKYSPDWYYNFHLAEEQKRGQDYIEDLFCPGMLQVTLREGMQIVVVISDNNKRGIDGAALWEAERLRKLALLTGETDGITSQLLLAAYQFLVKRGEKLKTIIAGYHWFTDWSRDTMISLPGLCLTTGRYADAQKILSAFSLTISQGMLPNRFADNRGHPEYNNADGTLWFFVAVYKYYLATGDKEFVLNNLLPILDDIIEWHYRGTRYQIKAEEGGLLYCGEPGVQLTWMDAKIGDYVVTPRTGYAVEINALWYNALYIMSILSADAGAANKYEKYEARLRGMKEKFVSLFWNAEGGYLYDVVHGDSKDDSIRPNQLLAISLPFVLLDGEMAASVLNIVTQELYTPYGLRSLSPAHPAYRGIYEGDSYRRDAAYHQGTVWSWLLGPYADACVKCDPLYGIKKVQEMVKNFLPHLQEAGIGTVSEIFDGNYPHAAKGCIAQAWGVAEWLRIYKEYYLAK